MHLLACYWILGMLIYCITKDVVVKMQPKEFLAHNLGLRVYMASQKEGSLVNYSFSKSLSDKVQFSHPRQTSIVAN